MLVNLARAAANLVFLIAAAGIGAAAFVLTELALAGDPL